MCLSSSPSRSLLSPSIRHNGCSFIDLPRRCFVAQRRLMSTGRRIQAPLPLHVVCIQHKRNAKSDDRQEYHHAFNALSSSHIVRERRDERTVTREYHFVSIPSPCNTTER